MKIKEEHLKTLWYEDKDDNFVEKPDFKNVFAVPPNANYQVSRFPNVLRTSYLKLIKQKDVDKCKRPKKQVEKTEEWVEGIRSRKCGCECGKYTVVDSSSLKTGNGLRENLWRAVIWIISMSSWKV